MLTNSSKFYAQLAFTGNSSHFFADLTICLNKMLRKGTTFDWTKQCENVFKLLKEELTKMPALQFSHPNKPFQLFSDTSEHSYSRILHQKKEGQLNEDEPVFIPIVYFSGTLQQNATTLEHYTKRMLCSLQIS